MNRVSFLEKTGCAVFIIFPLLFISGLIIAQWPEWWMWVIFEQSPMTWLEATILFSCSLLSAITAAITFLNREDRHSFYWFILSAGFAYLCFDERFAIHERIRDSFLAPRKITLPFLPWAAPGDFILILFMIAGITALFKLIIIFKEYKRAYRLFIAGVCIAGFAVLLDSWDMHIYSIEIQRAEQFIEELIETSAMICFASSIWIILINKTGLLIRPE